MVVQVHKIICMVGYHYVKHKVILQYFEHSVFTQTIQYIEESKCPVKQIIVHSPNIEVR